MANYFDSPDLCADGEFRTIHYRSLLPEEHPARYIDRFVSGLDVSSFEARYKVGPGQKGRAPKDTKLMLKVILYAIFSRMYSAHRIDYATEHYADFWLFTYGKRISHDKISDFINKHEDDIHAVFLETIYLAHKNNLLDFSALYQDGFFLKANASKKKNYTKKKLKAKKERLSKRLTEVLSQLKEQDTSEELQSEKKSIENKLAQLGMFQEELQAKINARTIDKDASKVAKKEEGTVINGTDSDSDLMRQKDGSFAASYLKVTGTDSKADIVIASDIDGYNDESHKALPLFEQANENCSTIGKKYPQVVADSNFTSASACADFEEKKVFLTGPTRSHENQVRHPEKYTDTITMKYDESGHCVHCSEGAVLYESERYYDKHKQATIMTFVNKEACVGCQRLRDCTKSKNGYRRVKININSPAQTRTLERYKNPEGQRLYKKRSHVAETFQGDLKKNGSFTQLLRRGVSKVKCDSIIHDIVWNLRRILSAKEGKVVWCS
ncbi:MAG: hypothetical protein GY858_00460 [Candidatus Omnitrophica bacterium]|nr:hypothetical protein [Candidatus Omnitrophota bacterium]